MADLDQAIDDVLGDNTPAPKADPLDDAVGAVVNDSRQKLRASTYQAVRTNPDHYAKAKKLAAQTGLPAEVVERNFDDVNNRANLASYDELLDSAPTLAGNLQDPQFAKVAHDDTGALAGIEQRIKQYGELKGVSPPEPGVMSWLKGQKESLVQGWKSARLGMQAQAQDLLNTLAPEEAAQQEARRQDTLRKYLQAQDILEITTPEFETATARGIYGGVSSFNRQLPGLALSVLTRNPAPALGLIGIETEAAAYGKYRARGASAGEALLGGVGEGATEVATELLPMSFLTKQLGRAGAGQFLKGLLARELPTEQVATLVQDAIDTAIANPDKTWAEYAAERPDAAYQTLVATLTQSAITGGLNAGVNRLTRQERQVNEAQANAEALQDINQLATDSKLRTRDPESFAQYIGKLTEGTPMETVSIPVEQWNQYWQGVKADPRAMAIGIVGNADQYDEAHHTGGDIVIPTSRYAAQLAATEHAKALEKDIRVGPSDLTAREAEELDKQLKQEAEPKESSTAEKVREDIVGQLTKAGQERTSADSYALLHEAFFRTLGAKAGMDPMQLYGEYGLKIDRPLPEALQKDANTSALDVFLDRLRAGKLPSEKELQGEGGAGLYEMRTAMTQLGKALEARGIDINVVDNATIKQELMNMPAPTGTELFQSGTLEEFMTSKAAERQKKITDAGLVVAIKNGKDVLTGQPGLGHIHLLMQNPTLPNSAETGYADRTGKFYTRAQAMETFGVVDSANITELNQPAYHGSPHDFEKFTTEKIGSGEGAQAYGWGLYFAENPEVALTYSNMRAKPNMTFRADGEKLKGLEASIADDIIFNGKQIAGIHAKANGPDFLDAYNRIKDKQITRGSMYQVDISDEAVEKMLDWDKPLAKQNPSVREALKKAGFVIDDNKLKEFDDALLAALESDSALDAPLPAEPRNPSGEDIYRELVRKNGSDAAASKYLNSIGIPGIKYLDQGSRTKGEGSRNLVVFDDSIVTVTHKDGKPLTAAEKKEFFQTNTLDQKKGEDKRGSIRFGNDRQFTINLFEKADLSTFLHESGHFFLEVFGDVAEGLHQTDPTTLTASQQLVLKDYEAMLKWLGVESRDQIKTDQHEKWAEAFEKYLMEGKAPSAELRGAFAKFRAWLVSLYKSLTGLKVELNDDVRGIMDRLLATEEEIESAAREAELMPIFTDATSAGMTEIEFAAYRKTVEGASAAAKDQLQQQLMQDIRREQEKWWKDARKTLRETVEAQVNQQPAYVAESILRTGALPDGTTEGVPQIKLSRQAIEDAYGKDVLKKIPRGTTAVDGVGLSEAADLLGYESAEKLLMDLTTLRPKNAVIEAETDLRMREQHGDMLLDGTAAVEAEKLVMGEERAKIVQAEIRALRKKMAESAPAVRAERQKAQEDRRQGLAILTAPMASQAVLRQMAEGVIVQKRIRDIQPNSYLIAIRRAAKEAVKLAGKDDYQGAAMEKQRELLNIELYRAANARIAQIEKQRKYLTKFDKPQKNLRGEFVEQIDNLLSRFDLKRRSLKAVDQQRLARTPIAQWVNEEAERLAAVVPDLPGFVMDESYRKNFKDMTAEEFEGLVDSVKQLEKLARRENEQYMALREMNFEQERAAIVKRIRQFHPEAFSEDGTPKEQEPDFVPSLSKAAKKLGDKFAGEFLNTETILNLLEGGEFGQVEQSLFGRMSDRSNWKASRLEAIYKQLKPLFGAYTYQQKLEFSRKDIGTPIGIPLTRENAVVTALLYGNQDGRERLMNYGWSDAQLKQIVGLLDKRDMDLVEGIWKLFDQDLWPELKALNERTKGKAPPKVAPAPYLTKHGEASGGYFRLKYDTELDERAHQFDETQGVKDMLGGSMGMTAKTNQGTSQERIKGVKLRPRLDLGVFSETVNETVHDLAYREAVADTMKLLNDEELQKSIKGAAGIPAYRALIARVREVAAPPRNPSGFIEKTLSVARKNTVVALLSGLRTALVNLTGVIPAFTRVNSGLLLREVAKFYGPKMAERYHFAVEHSEYMKHRFTNFDRDLQDMARKMTVNGKILPDVAGMLWFMGMTDRGVAVPVWNAAFAEGMQEHKNDVKMAVEYADSVVRQTQGSGRDVDLSQIMSGHGGWGQLKKVFTMFYSYFNAQLAQLVRSGAISKREAQENAPLAVARFTGRFMLIVALPAILSTIGGRDDDDINEKNWFKKISKALVMYGAGMVPLVRDLTAFAWSQFDKSTASFGFKLSPVQSAAEGVVKGMGALSDIVQGEGDKKDAKALIMGASYAVGLPGKLISDVTTGTASFLHGESGPQAMFFGPEK